MPDWSEIIGLTKGLAQANGSNHPDAMRSVLGRLKRGIPDVDTLRYYRLEGRTAILMASTDDAGSLSLSLASAPSFEQASQQQAPLWLPEQGQWIAPIWVSNDLHGLLVVSARGLADETRVWLELAADQIGLALAASQPQSTASLTLDQLANVGQLLTSAESYQLIGEVVMGAMPPSVVALIIDLFETPIPIQQDADEAHVHNARYTIVTTTREASLEVEHDPGAMPDRDNLRELLAGGGISVQDIQADIGYISGWKREQIVQYGANQVIGLPMRAGNALVGTLDLLFETAHGLGTLDIYTPLADLVGMTIYSRRLLSQSIAAQSFASQIVLTNKAVAESESYEEMAQAVLADSPGGVEAVAIALFDRPFTLMGQPSSLRTIALVSELQVHDIDVVPDPFSAVDDARVTYFLHQFLEGRMMMLWNAYRPRKPVMAVNIVERMRKFDADWILAVGLNVNKGLRGVVVFASQQDLRSLGPAADGLRAIADQLAATIENRILIERTTSALDLIQTQYESTSRIFRAESPAQILDAIYSFAEGLFNRAHLVMVDADEQFYRVAEIDVGGTHEVRQRVALSDYPASRSLAMLEALEIRDVMTDTFLTNEEREDLLAENVGALIILPITRDQAVEGIVVFTNATPVQMQPDQLRAMRGLVDQVGIVLENQRLFGYMQHNLNELESLYEVNRALLRTQDMMDILRAVREKLSPSARRVYYVSLAYRDAAISEVILRGEIIGLQEQLVYTPLNISPKHRETLLNYLNQLTVGVEFTPRGTFSRYNPLHELASDMHVASYVTLFLRGWQHVTGLIYLVFDEPQTFDERTRRFFEAVAGQVSIAFESQTFLQDSQIANEQLSRQVKALQTVSELAVRLNFIRDERGLLRTSVRSVVEALNADHASVMLFDNDLSVASVASEYPEANFAGYQLHIAENPLFAQEHDPTQAVLIENVAHSEQLSDELRRRFQEAGIVSVLIAPLVGVGGELLGSIGVDIRDTQRSFTDSEVRTIQTIAAQVAVGLQNVRLLSDVQARAEQLQRISDFSQVTQSTLELQAVTVAILSEVPRLIRADHITIAVHSRDEGVVYLLGGQYRVDSTWVRIPGGDQVILAGSTTGYVYETGDYLYIPDLSQSSGVSYPHAEDLGALLVVPLRSRGVVNGVVSVGTYRTETFTETDIAVFQQMVNQMSVALENAQAYTQSQRLAKNKALASDISVQLQQQTDIQKMVDLTMNELGQAIGAKRGRIRLISRRQDS